MTRGKNQQTRKRVVRVRIHRSYLLEHDDQGDSDDDETESVVRPQPTKVFRYMTMLSRYMFFVSIQFTNICQFLLMHVAYLIFLHSPLQGIVGKSSLGGLSASQVPTCRQ